MTDEEMFIEPSVEIESLKKIIDHLREKNDELEIILAVERSKNEVDILSSDTSDEDDGSSLRLRPNRNNYLISSLLEYRYEELSTSYDYCMKKLSKTSKYLRHAVKESDYYRSQNLQLTNENIELNKRIEKICFMFLKLLERRNDEVNKLTHQIERLEAVVEKQNY